MDKRALSERDICTKFITPAIIRSKAVCAVNGEDANARSSITKHLHKGAIAASSERNKKWRRRLAGYTSI